MTQCKTVSVWLLALPLAALAPRVHGQTVSAPPTAPAASEPAGAGEEQTVQLSPFVVQSGASEGYTSDRTLSGTRYSADILDLATSITVLNSQMISDFNAEDVQHLVGLGAAGVTQNQWLTDDVMIRGFRANYSMYDGVTQNSYTPTPMYDVERVEVIKGPQAMVMGDNTFIGGALNFVFRPATAEPHTDVVVTGTTDSIGVSYARLQANQSGPLFKTKDVTGLYRVTVGGTAGNSDHPEEDHDQRFIGAQLLFYIHDDTSVTIDSYYFRNNDQNYFDDFLVPTNTSGVATLSPYSTRTFAVTTRPASLQEMNEALFHVKFLTRFSQYDNLRVFFSYVDYYLLEAQVYGAAFLPDGYTLERNFVNYLEKDLQYTAQADFVDQRGLGEFVNNAFTTGVDYRQFEQPAGETFFQNQFPNIDVRLHPDPAIDNDGALAAADNLVPYNTFYDTLEYLYTFSYYVEERLSFLQDRIFINAGYRWYHSRATNQDFVAGTLAETDYAPFQAENLGLIVKPTRWLSFYYSHVTTMIPVAGYGIPLSGPPYPFKPSAGKDNEVGLKLDYRVSDHFRFYGAWDHFYEELTNVRTPVPGEVNEQTGVPVILQSASNTSSGWELDSGARLSLEPMDIDLLITAYRADTHSALENGGWATNAVGDTFSVLGKFTFKEGPVRGLYIGGGGYQTGHKWEQPYIIETPNIYKSFAGYPITKWWSAQLNWDNMTNRRYINEVGSVANVETALPAEISLEMRFHW